MTSPARSSAILATILCAALPAPAETLYEATADQFEQLRNHRLNHVELSYKADGELIRHEFPFGRGNGGKMQKFAGCMLDATL